MPEQPKVFISYAHRDASYLAERLHRDLTSRGFYTWFDTLVTGGSSWTRETERALDQCDVVLALLSDASYDSEYCLAEQLRCIDSGKPLIPILVNREAHRPLHLQSLQVRDFSAASDYSEHFEALLTDIADRLRKHGSGPRAGSTAGTRLRSSAERFADLTLLLSLRLFGQPEAVQTIAPYAQMLQAGLAPPGRPGGVFLLMGPTGVGKTATVEALAHILHGDARKMLKVDCGEYQMEHEVAKLIGAPPGYLGHRETQPILAQQRLNAVTSDNCALPIVLFDEIEKAAPSMVRLLLGILDRATLRLGDNTFANFENSLIFLTSNLGAREMMKELHPEFGFQAGVVRADGPDLYSKLEGIALGSVRKKFSPEFVNRIDRIVTYRPLDDNALWAILNHEISEVQWRLSERAGGDLILEVPFEVKKYLLDKGRSAEYGARELKRTIYREFAQPLSAWVTRGRLDLAMALRVEIPGAGGKGVRIIQEVPATRRPRILLVEDDPHLRSAFEVVLADAGWRVVLADSIQAAKEVARLDSVQAVLTEQVLPDGSGLELGFYFRMQQPTVRITMMASPTLTKEDEALCITNRFALLRKPLVASQVLRHFQVQLNPAGMP